MLSINSNPLAAVVARSVNDLSSKIQDTGLKLATGKRILSAKDDPSGVGILSTLKTQNTSYSSVQKNLTSGQSLLDVASSSLSSQQDILRQMKELATQASSDLLDTNQRASLQESFSKLQAQLDETVNKASLFGQNITGSSAAQVKIQSGIKAGDTLTINAVKSDAVTLKVDAATLDLTDSAKASAAMTAIDTATGTVANSEASLGAVSKRLEMMQKNTSNIMSNLEKSISRIEDVDVAAESSKLTLLQTQQQVSVSLLSTINQLPSLALSLLR
jgi:flagellin